MSVSLNDLLRRLRNPHARALAWLIGSNNLMNPQHPVCQNRLISDAHFAAKLTSFAPWLIELDAQPDELQQRIAAAGTQRLGRYAEVLLRYWLDHQTEYALLMANRTIQRGTTTLGEIDFLLHEKRYQRILHWEFAVKFYLLTDATLGLDGFVGMRQNDTLGRKVEKVFGQQLKLTESPEAQAMMPPGMPVRPEGFFKGVMFYPVAQPVPNMQALNPGHARGWWLRFGGGLEGIDRLDPKARYVVLKRQEWLHPIRRFEKAHGQSLSTLRRTLAEHFKSSAHAVMVAGLTEDDIGWAETQRGVIVPPGWAAPVRP